MGIAENSARLVKVKVEAGRSPIRNMMTVDVEEHFQVSAFENVISRSEWGSQPSRVVPNTERLLDLFERFQVRATFFALGCVAERYPALVPAIAKRGHEIACHGYSHRLIYHQTKAVFREETVRAKRILEDQAGSGVHGYRAASFSIGESNYWALDILAEAGFRYDSSLFPVRHDRYGVPDAPRMIHTVKTCAGAALVEVPPSTVKVAGITLPVAGGGYLRLYPTVLTRWALRKLNRSEGMPGVVYIHPWEVDPEQPRVTAASMTSRFRHYVGLGGLEAKLEKLMAEFRFEGMGESIAGMDDLPIRELPETQGGGGA